MGRQVCELREKRLDQEEVVAEMTKAVEALRKEKEAMGKKEKMIDTALKQAYIYVYMHIYDIT
jgi:cilia- and flagella-associated protein 44